MSTILRLALLASASLGLAATGACSNPHNTAAAAPGSPYGAQAGGDHAAAVQPAQWNTFADPAEHAFTVDVPAGWSVQGGVLRINAIDVRTGVVARSPDGSIEIFLGDTNVPVFQVPNRMTEMVGLREGSDYDMGNGTHLTLAAYRDGRAFSSQWGAGKLGQFCQNPTPVNSRSLPQATSEISQIFASHGLQDLVDAGETTFTCQMGGAAAAGYVFAATEQMSSGENSIWVAKNMAGFASAAAQESEAAAILAHMVQSFRVDSEWAARQSQTSADVSRITAETNNAISNTISRTWEENSRRRDAALDRHERASRGTATYNDPVQGQVELPDAAHQWRLPNGTIRSTDGSDAPEPGALELPRVSQ